MAERVEIEFRRAALGLLGERTRLLVAVSGGADSMALLHLAHGLGRKLVVAHLDHGLRPGSAEDRRFVEAAAKALGLTCISARRSVARQRERNESLEETARRVRYFFLLQTMHRTRAEALLVGHTLDDQAETVLMRLVRGAGPAALAGIAESSAGPYGPILRPLLGIERRALREWLVRRGHAWREDPTNLDPGPDRNRVRLRILPLLAAELNPRVAASLVRAAQRLGEDARYLDELAEAEARTAARRSGNGRLLVSPEKLRALPAALAGRVARLLLAKAGFDARRVSARHVAALLDLASGPVGRRVALPGGGAERKSRTQLVLFLD